MKPLILFATLFIIGLSFNSFAVTRTKPDTVKKEATQSVPAKPSKPEFKPDPDKVFKVTLELTGQQIFSVTSGLEGSLRRHPQLSAFAVGEMEDDNKSIAKSIKSQAQAQQNIDYKKWQADTTATYHPDTLKSKVRIKSKKANNNQNIKS